MQELSLNVLDIAENSVRANASLVEITLVQNTKSKLQTLVIQDNGKGMSEEMACKVTDPFCTSRTTRKVGLGLPFLKMACEMTGGALQIKSALGVGTTITATFGLGHIDLAPLGDMAATISALVQCNPHIDFIYTFTRDETSFVFDTREARAILDGVPFSEPQVALFIKEMICENMQTILAGP